MFLRDTNMAPKQDKVQDITNNDLKLYLDKKFSELHETNRVQNAELAGINNKLDVIDKELFDCIVDCSYLRKQDKKQSRKYHEIDERLNSLEYSRNKNTLHFFNIPNQTDTPAVENVNTFLKNELHLQDTEAVTAFRVGNGKGRAENTGQQSHIIAKFKHEHDTDVIKRVVFAKPRGTHRFGLEEDLPKEWRENRQKMYLTHVKPAKREGKKVRWVENKLYINGRIVTIDNNHEPTSSRSDSITKTPERANGQSPARIQLSDSTTKTPERDIAQSSSQMQPSGKTRHTRYGRNSRE